MTIRDAVHLALGSLRAGKLRTFLTVLGMGVGVGAVLTVLTLGAAGEVRVEEEIDRLGVDKVWLHARSVEAPLTAQQAKTASRASGAPACAAAYTGSAVMLGGKTMLAQIAGYCSGFEAVHAPHLVSGRLLTPREYSLGSAVALVDQALAEEMGGDVIGQRITVGARKMRVVGVVDALATQAMSGVSGMVILPLKTLQDTFPVEVSEITLRVGRNQSAEKLGALALLAIDGGRDAYSATTLEEEIDAAKSVVRIFVMVLTCVAAVCMICGAIGVMNILLVSVRERQREIGLMKAIGSSSGQIAALFLLEAVAYALLGGLAGLIMGAVLNHVCGNWIGLQASLTPQTTAPTLLAACLIGLLFGVMPALRAAKLPPVTALRREN